MLRVHGLGKSFGELVALDSLDLAVARGTCTAVVGHNGSGKSTALACLAGRTRRTSGSVTFDDVPLFEKVEDPRARALVSYVGDAPAFYPDLAVREHVRLVAVAHGWQRDAGAQPRARDRPSPRGRGRDTGGWPGRCPRQL